MPELPEVESARGLLQAHLAGRTITGVEAADDAVRACAPRHPFACVLHLCFRACALCVCVLTSASARRLCCRASLRRSWRRR
jgi:hypothetical protein